MVKILGGPKHTLAHPLKFLGGGHGPPGPPPPPPVPPPLIGVKGKDERLKRSDVKRLKYNAWYEARETVICVTTETQGNILSVESSIYTKIATELWK